MPSLQDLPNHRFAHLPFRNLKVCLKAGWIFLIFLILSGCAGFDGKIVGNTFIQEYKGYRFLLPGDDWDLDQDAWSYAWDFGHVTYRTAPKVVYRRELLNAGDSGADIWKEYLPGDLKTRLFFNIDIGFRHKTHDMKIHAASISEVKLLEYLYWKRRPPMDLTSGQMIEAYLERVRNRPAAGGKQPAIVAIRNLPHLGEVTRFQQTTDEYFQVIYGIPLNRRCLFFSFKADAGTPEDAMKRGLETFRELVEDTLSRI